VTFTGSLAEAHNFACNGDSTEGSDIVNYVSPDTRPEEMLVDESASATVRQLGDAMTEMEVNGHFFGECSLTLVLMTPTTGALSDAWRRRSKR
jgi:hypothetical protein